MDIFFEDGHHITFAIIFALFFVMIVIPFQLIPCKQRSDNFAEAQAKSRSYTVYMDGKKMDQNEFDISTINGQNYDITFNDSKMEMYLNRR